MGMCLEPTPEMGEYSTEVRRDSFKIYGDEESHRFYTPLGWVNGIEISIDDIPKIRAALDQVEKYRSRKP